MMKKRTLRLINYIFIIAILLGTMYLDKVQAYSCDLFKENIFSDTSYSYSCESTPDASFNSNIRYNHECRVFATPEPSIDDSRPCTTQMLGNPNSNISESINIRTGIRYSARINAMLISAYYNADNNHEHYFTYNRSTENLFSILTVVVDYIHNMDGEK